MQQHHQLDISVSDKGGLDVKAHYRGHVPDLLSRFSDEVRARALRFVWWKTRYERRLLRASRDMPDWAKATIRQHILHERAVRIAAKLARAAEVRRLKEERRSATIVARHMVEQPVPRSEQRPQPDQVVAGYAPEPQAELRSQPDQVQREPAPVEQVKALPEMDAPAKAVPEPVTPVPEIQLPRIDWSSPAKDRLEPSLTELFAKATSALQATPQPQRDRSRGR